MKLLISDDERLDRIDDWQQDLKSCLKLMERFTSKEHIIDFELKKRMKRFEFIRKLSQCFESQNEYDKCEIKFKLVVTTYFIENGELRQYDLNKYDEIRENMQDLIND
jgi:hypothetical protein